MTVTPSILRYRVYTRSGSGPGSTSTVDWTFRPGTPSWTTSMDWNKRVRLRIKRGHNCWNLFHVLDKSYLLAYETDSTWFLVAPRVTLVVAWESLRGGCAEFLRATKIFARLHSSASKCLCFVSFSLHSWTLERESIHGHVRKHERLFATGHQSVDGQVRECLWLGEGTSTASRVFTSTHDTIHDWVQDCLQLDTKASVASRQSAIGYTRVRCQIHLTLTSYLVKQTLVMPMFDHFWNSLYAKHKRK